MDWQRPYKIFGVTPNGHCARPAEKDFIRDFHIFFVVSTAPTSTESSQSTLHYVCSSRTRPSRSCRNSWYLGYIDCMLSKNAKPRPLSEKCSTSPNLQRPAMKKMNVTSSRISVKSHYLPIKLRPPNSGVGRKNAKCDEIQTTIFNPSLCGSLGVGRQHYSDRTID